MSVCFLIKGIWGVAVAFAVCGFAAERDYVEGQGNGSWRQCLNISWKSGKTSIAVTAGQTNPKFVTQEEIHRCLKQMVICDRAKIVELQRDGVVRSGLGNMASCVVQCINDEGHSFLMKLDNKLSTKMTCFTTLRLNDSEGAFLTTTQDKLRRVREFLFDEGSLCRTDAYTDTELQILHELFIENRLLLFVRGSRLGVRAIIIHIYTEDDPCGWCAQALYNVFLKVQNDPQQAELAKMLRNGTKLIFEVSSTRQHLHAREFGCDGNYLEGKPIQIDLNEPQGQPLVFFSRFSDREIVQETVIHYNKSKVRSGRAAVLNVSEAQPKVLLSTRENVDGCVREVKLGVLGEKGTLLSKSFIFGRQPVSEQEFNQEIEKIQGKSVDRKVSCEIVGNRIEEKFWLKPVSREERQAAAKAQYDRSIFHIHELEAQIAKRDEKIRQLEAEVDQLKAQLNPQVPTPPAQIPQQTAPQGDQQALTPEPPTPQQS